MDKLNPRLFRFTGTFANPNALGFVVIFSFLTIQSYRVRHGLTRAYLDWVLLIATLSVVITSSRTSIVAFPLIHIANFLIMRRHFRLRLFASAAKGLLVIGMLLGLFIFVGVTFSTTFRYVAELFTVSSLLEIRSIGLRLSHYESMYSMIAENPLLGVGPQKAILRVGDNDYLFTLTQWGLLGALMKYGLYALLFARFIAFLRHYYDFVVNIATVSIVALFLFGTTVESFMNYKYLTVVLVLIGSAWAATNSRQRALQP
jgi:O-antigen ligase